MPGRPVSSSLITAAERLPTPREQLLYSLASSIRSTDAASLWLTELWPAERMLKKYVAIGADCTLAGRHFVRAAHGGLADGVALFANKMKNELAVAMVLTGARPLKISIALWFVIPDYKGLNTMKALYLSFISLLILFSSVAAFRQRSLKTIKLKALTAKPVIRPCRWPITTNALRATEEKKAGCFEPAALSIKTADIPAPYAMKGHTER